MFPFLCTFVQTQCSYSSTNPRDGKKEEYLQTINSEVGYVYASFISHQLYFHHSLAAWFIDPVKENYVLSFQITPLKG